MSLAFLLWELSHNLLTFLWWYVPRSRSQRCKVFTWNAGKASTLKRCRNQSWPAAILQGRRARTGCQAGNNYFLMDRSSKSLLHEHSFLHVYVEAMFLTSASQYPRLIIPSQVVIDASNSVSVFLSLSSPVHQTITVTFLLAYSLLISCPCFSNMVQRDHIPAIL